MKKSNTTSGPDAWARILSLYPYLFYHFRGHVNFFTTRVRFHDIIYVVPLLSPHVTYIYNKKYHICYSIVDPTWYLHIQQTISYMLFLCWAHMLPTYTSNDIIYVVPLLSPHVTYIYNKRYHLCYSIVDPTCYLHIQQTISYMLFHCWAHMLPTYTTNNIIYVVPLLSPHVTYIYNKRYHICCSIVEPTCYLHIQQTISYMLFHCWAHMLPTYTTNNIIYVVPLLSPHVTHIYNKQYHICCSTVEPTCYLHIQQTISFMLFHC